MIKAAVEDRTGEASVRGERTCKREKVKHCMYIPSDQIGFGVRAAKGW